MSIKSIPTNIPPPILVSEPSMDRVASQPSEDNNDIIIENDHRTELKKLHPDVVTKLYQHFDDFHQIIFGKTISEENANTINQIAGNSIFKKDPPRSSTRSQRQKRPLPKSFETPTASSFKRPRTGDAGYQDQQTTVTAAPQTSGYYSNQKGSNQSKAETAIARRQRNQAEYRATKYIKIEPFHRTAVRKLSDKVEGTITLTIKHYLVQSRYYHIFGTGPAEHRQKKIKSKEAFVINGISEQPIFDVEKEDLNEEEIEEATKIIEESLKKIYPNRADRAKGPASSVNPAAPPSNKQLTGAGNQRAFIDKNAPRSEIPRPTRPPYVPPTMPPFKTSAPTPSEIPPTMPPFKTSAPTPSEIPPTMPVSISNAATETNQGKSNSDLGFDFQDLHDFYSFEPNELNKEF